MSRVFVAEERALGRKVAVKVLPPLLSSGVNTERFQREIQVAARLQHAHIVPVLTAGDANGLPFYTMPFVEGESLRHRLEQGGALPIADVVSILRDVARALSYAHERGVVHRDIKPDNVMLSGRSAVVTDFGIAKAISASRTQDDSAGITQVGMSIGTPAYMAPEQAAGDPATDHRADLYAFGCMAFELLAGTPPFVEPSPQRLLAAHMARAADDIATRRRDTPPALAGMVMQCLEKRPEDRPDSAEAVAHALEQATRGGDHHSTPPIPTAAPGALWRALLVYAVTFMAVAVLARVAAAVIGLPDWVSPGALVVMGLVLPALLFTGYVQRIAQHANTATPTVTPGGSRVPVPRGTVATLALRASPHVSWTRAWRAAALGVGGYVAVVVVFMSLRALGIGPAGSLLASGTLSDREPLLVADFEVAGPDSALSLVLTEALRTGLGESRAISIVPVSAVASALQRMQRSPDAPMDVRLAREIAQREGIKAVVAAVIAPVASGGYLLSIRLVDASTGDVLASRERSAPDAQGLIPAVDWLSRRLRERIGESIRGVQATRPLEQVTTASLDALRKYAAATRELNVHADYAEAIRLSREAVAADSTFAMAYVSLARALAASGTGAPGESTMALDKAYEYRDRLTEVERLVLEAYLLGPLGSHPDRPRQIAAYERLHERYPEIKGHRNALALHYIDRQQFARADSLWAEARALGDTTLYNWTNPMHSQLFQGELAEARRLFVAARTVFPGEPVLDWNEGVLLYAEGKLDSAAAVFERFQESGNDQMLENGLRSVAAIYALRGQVELALRQLAASQAASAARGVRSVTSLPGALLWASFVLTNLDNPTMALAIVQGALQTVPLDSIPMQDRPYEMLAMIYAKAAQPALAREVLTRYEIEITDTVVLRLRRPLRQIADAWIELAEGRPLDAVATFRASMMLPDGPVNRCMTCLDAEVGLAFDRANMPDSAIVALESFVNGYAMLDVEYEKRAWATRRLGELYDAQGNREKAAQYLGAFVELWKDADPEFQPAVRSAQARLRELTDSERR